MKKNGPKILLLDIETSPLLSYTWGIWQQDVPLNMIEKDWGVLSWSAKWLNDKKIMYKDQRNKKNVEDDADLLKDIWKLLDEADVIVTQNGKKFDIKKLNARFIINGMIPPSPFQHIDTKQIASKHFAFTSNKLEYMCEKLGLQQQKSKHKKFAGFELWRQCILGNKEAWKEMEHYNKQDVLALEELYLKLRAWDNGGVNFHIFVDDNNPVCPSCGGKSFKKNGTKGTKTGLYQVFKCKSCFHQARGRKNLRDKNNLSNTLISV